MSSDQAGKRRLLSALFVDFDNIYLGLRDEHPRVAERFATEPGHWIKWVEERMPLPLDEESGVALKRAILLRRCYLSPRAFGNYRPAFTRSGFEVMDCPKLTSRGKNSADIRIVLDVVDALEHKTHFDEFIIFSSDSDFTPVMLRLRAHDRRTTILTAGTAVGAYRSACDLTIEFEEFIEQGIGVQARELSDGHGDTAQGGSGGDPHDLLQRIAAEVHEEVVVRGELEPGDLPSIYRRFDEFRAGSNWLGYNTLQAMSQEVVAAHDLLSIPPGDNWKVALVTREDPAQVVSATQQEASTTSWNQARKALTEMLERSPVPISLAEAAFIIQQQIGEVVQTSSWFGARSFKSFVERCGIQGVETTKAPPGYVYDAARHERPDEKFTSSGMELEEQHPDLAPVARQVRQITSLPILTPDLYARLFRFIGEETDQEWYSTTETSKTVRDRLTAEGTGVARNAISFVLKGIQYGDHKFEVGQGANPPIKLAEAFRDNILDICGNAGLELADEERELLDQWIAGGLRQGADAEAG